MKLHEIKYKKHVKKDSTGNEKTLTVDTYNYGKIKLTVKYDYEAPSSTRHGDDSSFDEDLPEQFNIVSIHLAQDVDELDEYNEVKKTWKKGTNVDKLENWSDRKDGDAVEDALYSLSEGKVHSVPKGTLSPQKPWEPSKGRDKDDPRWDWKNPNDNPSGEKPIGATPHKVNGKYDKANYPIVFDDAEDSVHLFDPTLVAHIKRDVGAGEWNKMGELDQIKTQIDYVSPPPTKAWREMTQSQRDEALDKQAKKLQSKINRG